MLCERIEQFLLKLNNTCVIYNCTIEDYENLLYYKIELTELYNTHKGRTKRGLINGLGSIIKSISGNLDNDDLIHLQNELETTRSIIKQKISLTSEIFENIHNRLKIVEKLEIDLTNSNGIIEQQILIDKTLQYGQILYELLLEIQSATVLAQHNILSPEIINLRTLQSTYQLIPESERIKTNILTLESLCKIRIYSNNPLTFVIEVPTIEKNEYEFITRLPIIRELSSTTCEVLLIPKLQLIRNQEQEYEVSEYKWIDNFFLVNTNKKFKSEDKVSTHVICPDSYINNEIGTLYIYTKYRTDITSFCNHGIHSENLRGNILIKKECDLKINETYFQRTVETTDEIYIPKINYETIIPFRPLKFDENYEKIEQQLTSLGTYDDKVKEHVIHFHMYFIIVAIVISLIIVLTYLYKNKAKFKNKYVRAPLPNNGIINIP